MRRLIPLAVGGAAVLTLAACSADTKDFREQGEQFIEDDEVRERFGMVRMSEAQCEEPADTNKDTLYTCTATGSDGNTYQFTIEITGSKSLRVISGEVVGQAAAPVSTEPAGSPPASEPTTAAPTTAAATTAAPSTTAAGATTAAATTAAAPTTTAP
jgi:hypothetical protein